MKYLLFLSLYLIFFNISYSQINIPRITFSYDSSGNQVSRCFGCSKKKPKKVNNENEKKIKKEDLNNTENEFSYFPNPVDDKLVLNWVNSSLIKVYILDMNSKLLANYNVSTKEKQYTIPFTNYIQGIYIINVVFEDNSNRKFKIIKK